MQDLEHKLAEQTAPQAPIFKHQQAQELASQASILVASGDYRKARQFYEQAAALEEQALKAMPVEKKRTRGIFAVSLVSLLYKAELYSQAEVVLIELLGARNLPDPAQHQLQELYDDIKSRKYVHGYRGYSPSHSHTTNRSITETESLARDIKEGLLSGFISKDTSLTGEVNFKNMLRVDGHLSGQVKSEGGTLIVGNNGQVDADIEVAVATIHGTVNGDIIASQRLELGRAAKVNGNIQTPSLVIEQGAVFEGSCKMVQLKAVQERQRNEVAESDSVEQSYGKTSDIESTTHQKPM